ncbi:hypothetical protein L1987_56155 [Smallanthus sonchifolius]|uniref:Uncharacterized protein n=1 Tax=Smallanthus sonchifolius TaxID=185202 RepID=A0ACB9ECD6_9ASTR|nr:hypothetical protein L1987_56155 [Smallanthus sonchifolius]
MLIHFVNPQPGILRLSAAFGSSSGADCFIKKGSLYRFKYEASREFLLAKLRGGTCTTARSDPPEEVIHRATYLHEHAGYFEYDLITNNCEDFALYSTAIPRSCLKRENKDLGVRDDVVKAEVDASTDNVIALVDDELVDVSIDRFTALVPTT